MHFTRIVLTFSLLVTVLASCTLSFPEKWALNVINQEAPGLGSNKAVFQECKGGLRATLNMPGLNLDSGQVDAGEMYSRDVSTNAQDGDLADIEAWCFREDGSEVGYIRATGTLKALKGYSSTFVEGPLLEGIDFVTCVETNIVRGTPPCIESSPALVIKQ